MICAPCARAADARAPRDQHCTTTGCTCGHRVERHQAATVLPPMIRLLADGEDPDDDPPFNLGPVLDVLQRQAAETAAHADAVEAAITRVEAAHGPEDTIHIPRTTTKD